MNVKTHRNRALPDSLCFLTKGFCQKLNSILTTCSNWKTFPEATGYLFFFLTRAILVQISEYQRSPWLNAHNHAQKDVDSFWFCVLGFCFFKKKGSCSIYALNMIMIKFFSNT